MTYTFIITGMKKYPNIGAKIIKADNEEEAYNKAIELVNSYDNRKDSSIKAEQNAYNNGLFYRLYNIKLIKKGEQNG